jgi:DNA-binding beta-propeller fold protein YncE
MSLRRVGRLAAMLLLTLLWGACGQVYRPVVIPCTEGGIPNCPVQTPPVPANFHAVFAVSANVPNYPGNAMQIDVSGDTIIAETAINGPNAPNSGGQVPTHAAVLPNNTRVFVTSAGSVVSGGVDGVLSFTPASQSTISTGFSGVNTVSLPSQTSSITAISQAGSLVTVTLSAALTGVSAGYTIVIGNVLIPNCTEPACNPLAYNGSFALSSISGTTIQYVNSATGLPSLSGSQLTGTTASVPPQPVFLNSTQNNAMYVANYNSNSVFAFGTSINAVVNTASVGTHPVAMVEMPNGLKLYVANQGSNSISSLNATDLSANVVTGFSGVNPVWMVARGDSQKVYVITEGDGMLVTIDTANDTVSSSLPVGAGANFVFFDPTLNRLYVTNPVSSMLYVFSDTGGPNDTPVQLAAISFAAPDSGACPSGCTPLSVTALRDGSRFYVASYQLQSSCSDPVIGASPCVVAGLSVFDANSFALMLPTLTLLTDPPFSGPLNGGSTYQYAVPPVAACASPIYPTLYAPGATRFRVFTTAAADSSAVYVSMCDAGAVAVINTTDSNTNGTVGSGTPADSLVTDLPAAYAGPSQTSGSPLQNPIFMLTGQ